MSAASSRCPRLEEGPADSLVEALQTCLAREVSCPACPLVASCPAPAACSAVTSLTCPGGVAMEVVLTLASLAVLLGLLIRVLVGVPCPVYRRTGGGRAAGSRRRMGKARGTGWEPECLASQSSSPLVSPRADLHSSPREDPPTFGRSGTRGDANVLAELAAIEIRR